jgi:lysine 2,3-aminomutase
MKTTNKTEIQPDRPLSPVRKRFPKAVRAQLFSSVSEQNWNDWSWQLSQREKSQGTPYYSGLLKPDAQDPIQILAQTNPSEKLSSGKNLFTSSELIIEDHLKTLTDANPIILDASYLPKLPYRITPEFIQVLSCSRTVIINTAFCHPRECTQEAFDACARLADAGFIINNRMLLIKGVNDDPQTVKELNHLLLMMRVRPYCMMLINLDDNRLQVTPEKGVQILESLRGWTSGLAVPHYVIKEKNGEFKVLVPNYIKKHENDTYVFRNYKNDEYLYREL